MTRATFTAYNVLKSNDAATVVLDLLQLAETHHASVMVLNEARAETDAGAGVDRFCHRHGWDQLGPAGDVRIVYRPDLWQRVHHDTRRLSDGTGVDGIPPRWALWAQLRHRESRMRHTVIGTHVTAGYAAPDADHPELREAMAYRELLTLLELSAELVRSRGPMLHLMGDLNALHWRLNEWWYPANLFDTLYLPDPEQGLLYQLHSRDAQARGLKLVDRSSVKLHSDHPAALKTVSW